MTKTAYACHHDSAVATSLCLDQLGHCDPGLLLVFAGGRHDPDRVLAAIRARHGAVPVHGGSAAGSIARSGLGYTGFEVGVVAFPRDVAPVALIENGLEAGGFEAGAHLGSGVRKAIGGMTDDLGGDPVVFLFYDGIAAASPLRLHAAAPIVEGFHHGSGGIGTHLVGGGLLGDVALASGWMFDGQGVVKHAAVALVFPPGIAASTVVLHGCVPASDPVELTRMKGAEVIEIEGRPALHVIEEALGIAPGTSSGRDLTLLATLGERRGDPFAPYDEGSYVNRLIVAADPARGSVTLFEPDFTEGTFVQIMSRDNAMMFSSVDQGVRRMNEICQGQECILGFYVDCAGRVDAMTRGGAEEAQLVCNNLSAAIPFLGFYSGVEIAPVAGGPSRALDWTGVLTVLSRRPGPGRPAPSPHE